MGWIRTIKSLVGNVQSKFVHIPSTLKKKLIRSKSVRSVLSKQLGRVLTGILEIHILALAGIGLKWGTSCIIQYIWYDSMCGQDGATRYELSYTPYYLETVCEWVIDIGIPAIFALSWHDPFLALVCWTFERPLFSLARRIQYMRPNDPYQFLRIKYIILVPCLLYIGAIVTLFPLSRNFIQICLAQTLIIQGIKDFWPLRCDWVVLPEPAPKITLLEIRDDPTLAVPSCPTQEEAEKEKELDWKMILQGRTIRQSHFPDRTVDPFVDVIFT